MIALMQKLIKTTKSKISGGLYLTSFYKNVQNLKYNIKGACMFHLILVGILSILILSVKNRGWGGGGRVFVNGQNLLSVTKVIC